MSNFNSSVIAAASEINDVQDSLPVVMLPGNGVTITDTAYSLAMAYRNADNAENRLYNRGNAVFYVDRDSNNAVMLSALSTQRACSEFERVASICKQKSVKGDNTGKTTAEPAVCNPSIAKTILSASAFLDVLPKKNLITNAPIILKGENNDCRIINSYDERSGILPTGTPTEDVSLEEAIGLLNGLLTDFNFQSEGDKSRALAALLTPALVAGGILDARAPIMMLEADKSQSGKGFFTKLLGAVYNELPSTVAQRSGGVGGLEESFDSALTLGRAIIVIDNLRGKLNSPQIEAFMTADVYSARIPYSEPAAIDPKRYFIMATSNDFKLTQDMANRSCFIRIFKRSRTYLYRTFPEGNILKHIKANQSKYLGAIFAVIKEWVHLGCQTMPCIDHDFRDWCSALDWILRNILHEAPLMKGHKKAQLLTMCPEFGWLNEVWNTISILDEANTELSAYQIAERCALNEIELAGANDVPFDKLDENGMTQVCSQIGRRFSNLFKKLGEEDEIYLGNFSVKRESKKVRYPSGNMVKATFYQFSPMMV